MSDRGAPHDRPYDRLQRLPRELWLPTLVTAIGTTAQRLEGCRAWLAALTDGALPAAIAGADADPHVSARAVGDAHANPVPGPVAASSTAAGNAAVCGARPGATSTDESNDAGSADFGDPAALAPMRAAVAALGLAALCRGVPALAQQVLRTMLWHLDRIADAQPRLTRAAAIAAAARGFHAEWTLQASALEEQLALLRGLGELGSLRWDQLQGLLNAREVHEAQRLSALLAHLQPLVELIRALGRAERLDTAPPARAPEQADARIVEPMHERETRLSDAPGEVTGIHASRQLDRMLGSEAVQIRHPVLRKLWRARLAEGRLLTYESEGVLVERVPDPQARPPAPARPQTAPLARGPIIVCLDTSGSMQGAPERIAKAIVLETLRTAQRERRGCLLVAFGAHGEMLARPLHDGPDGLRALLDLLAMGFDGGTDVQSPIEYAVARVHEAGWRSADLLIVSDGEFGCVPETLHRLDRAKAELGLRVQGVLIGDRETMGLLETCDHIHWQRDWRRFDNSERPRTEAVVPVHSASLTALYFPNALSPRAARPKT